MQSTPSYPSAAAARKASWKAPGDGADVSGSTSVAARARPELVGREGGAVDELLGAEPDGERNDGHVPLRRQFRREITRAIGYHPNPGHRLLLVPRRLFVARVHRSPVAGHRRVHQGTGRRVCHGTARPSARPSGRPRAVRRAVRRLVGHVVGRVRPVRRAREGHAGAGRAKPAGQGASGGRSARPARPAVAT